MSSPSAKRVERRRYGMVSSRIAASVLATGVAVWFAISASMRALPLSDEVGGALGMLLPFPLWVTAMCFAFLARSVLRVWLVCLCTFLAAALLLVVT